MPGPRILVVDDDPVIRELYTRLFASEGIHADLVDGTRAALEHIAEVGYDLVVLDLLMPGWDGLTAIKAIEQGRPGTPVLVVTGVGDDAVKARAVEHVAVAGLVEKPFENDVLLDEVRRHLPS